MQTVLVNKSTILGLANEILKHRHNPKKIATLAARLKDQVSGELSPQQKQDHREMCDFIERTCNQ